MNQSITSLPTERELKLPEYFPDMVEYTLTNIYLGPMPLQSSIIRAKLCLIRLKIKLSSTMTEKKAQPLVST